MSIYKSITGYGPRAKKNGRYYSILGPGLSSNLEKGDKFVVKQREWVNKKTGAIDKIKYEVE